MSEFICRLTGQTCSFGSKLAELRIASNTDLIATFQETEQESFNKVGEACRVAQTGLDEYWPSEVEPTGCPLQDHALTGEEVAYA